MASPEFVAHCTELLAPLGSVRVRRMFGGHGVYLDGLFMAIIADDELYLKADDITRAAFDAESCAPFVYSKDGKDMTMNYRRAPHFALYADELKSLYLGRRWGKLADLNSAIIIWGLGKLDIAPKILAASELGVEDKSSTLLARLCEKIGAETYLSGISGKDYLDESEFLSRGVRVEYQEFHHPVYPQIHGAFEPCMSFIDLLFNAGPRSADILRDAPERLTTVFN